MTKLAQDRTFMPVFGYRTTTHSDLLRGDMVLQLDDRARELLVGRIGTRCYTYLVLANEREHEVVRVGLRDQHLYLERGIDNTGRYDWPCGTTLSYEPTPAALLAMWRQAEGSMPEPPCPEPAFTGSFCAGIYTYHVEDGLIMSRERSKAHIYPGCYDRPVITFDDDGCISAVAEGSAVASLAGCCG